MKKLIISLSLLFSMNVFATAPHAVQQCIFSRCLSQYYLCDGGKTCAPKLSHQQKITLDAYHLCQATHHKSCQTPGIMPTTLKQLQKTQQAFNACKVSCYQHNAKGLYRHIFK